MTELRVDARRDPVPRINVGFHRATNSRSVLRNSISGSRRDEAGHAVAVRDLAKPAEIARDSRPGSTLPGRIDDPRALEFGQHQRAVRPAGDAHRTMQPRRDNPRFAVDRLIAITSRAGTGPTAPAKGAAPPAHSRDRPPPVRLRRERDIRHRRGPDGVVQPGQRCAGSVANDDPPPESPTATSPPSLAAERRYRRIETRRSVRAARPISGSEARRRPDETSSCPSAVDAERVGASTSEYASRLVEPVIGPERALQGHRRRCLACSASGRASLTLSPSNSAGRSSAESAPASRDGRSCCW